MKTITEEQIKEALCWYQAARSAVERIMKGRRLEELSNSEYARTEYWKGKIIGMEDVFQALGIDYRRIK